MSAQPIKMSLGPQTVLTNASPHAPSLKEFLLAMIAPILISMTVLFHGLPRAILTQVMSLSPYKMFNIYIWRDLIWGYGSPPVLQQGDRTNYNVRKEYLSHASGRVLEVGAGSGELIKYYRNDLVEHLYLLEPFLPLVEQLRQKLALREESFKNKTTVLVAGIQEEKSLRAESMDTLVLCQCMCSIPDYQTNLKAAVEYLKPGGKLILIEHVASSHPTTRLLQDILTPLWSFAFNGCELNRDTVAAVMKLQQFEDIQIKRPVAQTTADLIPHVYLLATKRHP
ncbi:unnamed protein product [Sympodiomycopsis kandeliae]